MVGVDEEVCVSCEGEASGAREGGARTTLTGGYKHLPWCLPTTVPLAYAQQDPFRRVHYRTTATREMRLRLLRDFAQVLNSCFSSFSAQGLGDAPVVDYVPRWGVEVRNSFASRTTVAASSKVSARSG